MNAKLDVWAFGLMLWEIFTQELIFNHYEDAKVYAEDICNKKVRPPKNTSIPSEVTPIISDCLKEAPHHRPTFAEIKERLEEARVTYFLGFDQAAQAFWTKYWPTQGKVDWVNESEGNSCFLPCLARNLKFPYDSKTFPKNKLLRVEGSYLPLYTYHAGKPSEITLEDFRKVLLWFGPFNNLLSNLEQYCSQPWFWGAASYEISRSSLASLDPGCFIVRLNLGRNQPITDTPYTICYVDANKKICDLRVWLSPTLSGLYVKDVAAELSVKDDRSLITLINALRVKCPKLLINPVPYVNSVVKDLHYLDTQPSNF